MQLPDHPTSISINDRFTTASRALPVGDGMVCFQTCSSFVRFGLDRNLPLGEAYHWCSFNRCMHHKSQANRARTVHTRHRIPGDTSPESAIRAATLIALVYQLVILGSASSNNVSYLATIDRRKHVEYLAHRKHWFSFS